MIGTSLASLSRPLWRVLKHQQIDPEFIFREAGLDPALMDESRSRFQTQCVSAAWRKAAELIPDPCFGLKVAEAWFPTDLHALGYAFLASSTLRTALQRLCRYISVVDNAVGFELDDDGERVLFKTTIDNSPLSSSSAAEEDATLAFATSLCRATFGGGLNLVEVRFQHEAFTCGSAYDDFFRCPVLFKQNGLAIVFNRADVDQPLPAANRELARANEQILVEFLANLRDGDLISRVKSAIVDELPSGSPSGELIAKAVFMSPRSLRRRLSAEGTSYTQVLDAVRRELAEQYVADTSRSLSEISYLLGFSELSSFSRAFKRWTGQTPGATREAMSA